MFSSVSLSYWFEGEAGKRRMRLAELRPSSRLAQLKPERLVQPKVRKAFPDTAFWAADVTTDALPPATGTPAPATPRTSKGGQQRSTNSL